MTEFQRKIELQSLDDLLYLVSNMRQAAHDKIDIDLPPLEGEDPMRKRVEAIVSQYIEKIVKSISANITINGLEPTQSMLSSVLQSKSNAAFEIEEYEPFNTQLIQQAQKLARQEDDLIEEIAAIRRNLPKKLVEKAKTEFKNSLEEDDALIRALQDQTNVSESGPIDLNLKALERQNVVEQDWNKGVRELGSLMRSLPEMVAKKVRAEEVETFMIRNDKK